MIDQNLNREEVSDVALDPMLVVRQSTAPPPTGVGRLALSRLDMGLVLWIQGTAGQQEVAETWRPKTPANTGHGLWLPLAR
jgi:hypothetical protein